MITRIDKRLVAYDPNDILGFPEVGVAIEGRPVEAIRYVGAAPEASDWELAVLANGKQVPGGGFHIFPEEKRRYVAYYGHPDNPALGALGERLRDARGVSSVMNSPWTATYLHRFCA